MKGFSPEVVVGIFYLCFAALVEQLFNPQLRLSPVV